MGYVFISYSSKNQTSADAIRELFRKHNIDIWMAPYDIPVGRSYEEVVIDAIKNSSCFLLILSEESQKSTWIGREFEIANIYHKPILPVEIGETALISVYKIYLAPMQFVPLKCSVPDAAESEMLVNAAKALSDSSRDMSDEEKKELLYSQIIELQKGDSVQFCKKLSELILFTGNGFASAEAEEEKLNIFRQLIKLYKMYWKNSLGYGNEYKEAAKHLIETSSHIRKAVCMSTPYKKLLLFSAYAIAVLREDKKVKDDCIDCFTSGDVHSEPGSGFKERISPFATVVLNLNYDADYTEEEVEFINDIHKFVVSQSYENVSFSDKKEKEKDVTADNQFQAIAEYFSKGNKLFSAIGNDEIAEDFFNCLLLSYERLKNYCLEVGAKKTYSDCVVKISELKQAKLRKSAQKSEPTVAERGIKALLGLTMPKSGAYDAFISYKHYDEDRAKRVYSFLQQNLKEVFFDKESLPELSKSDYEHAVMSALDNSKHFIVIISKLELLESSDFIEGDWVRREMRAFNTEIQEGRKKDANFIILASDEVCDEIFAKNKENIDIMWRWQEIIRLSEFESVLARYIK